MLRGQTDEKNPSDWFYFAMDRLKVADLVWKTEGLTPSGIELLQEAVERFLKGYLVANGWKLVKTHDLATLLRNAQRYDAKFSSFKRLATDLTEDFFAQHYPGDDLTDLGREYELNRQEIGEMITLIKSLLPQFAADLILKN
jgi:HEPN domain-containing protein